MSAFNVEQTAKKYGWDAVAMRRMMRMLQIPQKEDRQLGYVRKGCTGIGLGKFK